MLQAIHDHLKGIFAIVILVALGVVFVFWGVNVNVGSFTAAQGIEVNGQELDANDMRRLYQDQLSRYQAALGAAGVPAEMRDQLRTQVLEQTVRNALIQQRGRELRYAASDAQVLEAIRQVPAFQVDGKFSSDAYHAALRSAAILPKQFEDTQREFAIARQIDRGIFTSAFVLPRELEREVALRNEMREIAWVLVPASRFMATVALDGAALQSFYESHRSLYMTEERAAIAYVELNIETLASQAAVSDEQLREYYESVKDRYTVAGRRRARHILIGAKGDAAAAEARARAAYDRARAGEDFAALARELSDDAGTVPVGGDLGWASRGDFVGAFGDAVWDMQPGEIRGPVRSEFGWHVIRLEEAEPGSTRSFEEVRAELESEFRRTEVEKQFGELQDELDTRAFEAAGNLAAVAGQMGLPVRRIDPFTRAGGGDLGAVPALIEAVFSPEVLAGRELRTVEFGPGRVIAVRVDTHEPARERPFDEVRDQVTAAARLVAAQRQAAEQAKAVVAQLTGGDEWLKITRAWQSDATGAPAHRPRLLGRSSREVPAEIASAAFRAPRPEGRARFGTAELGTGDAAVWMVSAVRPGSLAGLAQADGQREHDQARERSSQSDASVYVEALRAAADVDVNPQIFE